MKVSFTVPGPPVPKARARRDPKRGRWYTPHATKAYMEAVRWRANVAARGGWPVGLACFFPDAKRRDGDNVLKGVLDACNEVLWDDDSQVVDKRVTKHVDRDKPRVEVEVEVVG
ncbi:MAG: RusA family crossover junction endodeoxyribonuclease [Myxococcota bacterium]